jgi:Skp family chaperone for outer membrane proteins
MRYATLFALVFVFAVIGGCQQKDSASGGGASSGGGVAVLDLDRAAKAMGWLDDIQSSLRREEQSLASQFQELERSRVAGVAEMRKAIASEAKLSAEQIKQLDAAQNVKDLEALPLTPQQRQQLVEGVARAQADLQVARNNVAQALQGRRASLISGYRDRVRPIAGRVAAAQGMTIVMLAHEAMLHYDPKVDITDKVIEEMQKVPATTQPSGG